MCIKNDDGDSFSEWFFASMMVLSHVAFDQFLNFGRIDVTFFAMTNL